MAKRKPIWRRALDASFRYAGGGAGVGGMTVRESRIYGQGWKDGRKAALREKVKHG